MALHDITKQLEDYPFPQKRRLQLRTINLHMLDETYPVHSLSVAHTQGILELKDNYSRPKSSLSDYNQGVG